MTGPWRELDRHERRLRYAEPLPEAGGPRLRAWAFWALWIAAVAATAAVNLLDLLD